MTQVSVHQNELIPPFCDYPHKGRQQLGLKTGENCRHGYGRAFQQRTGQHQCAYCGLNLTERFEDWLTMALDHVVPDAVCKSWELPNDWKDDYSNFVLSCTACNTFGNRYHPKGFRCPGTIEEFYTIRDKIFVERKALIAQRRFIEKEYFEGKPWEKDE